MLISYRDSHWKTIRRSLWAWVGNCSRCMFGGHKPNQCIASDIITIKRCYTSRPHSFEDSTLSSARMAGEGRGGKQTILHGLIAMNSVYDWSFLRNSSQCYLMDYIRLTQAFWLFIWKLLQCCMSGGRGLTEKWSNWWEIVKDARWFGMHHQYICTRGLGRQDHGKGYTLTLHDFLRCHVSYSGRRPF